MKRICGSQTGLSLIEVALGMMILGLLMAGALSMYRVYQYQRGEEVTILHMDAVEEAIGTYVSRFQRYPVPMAFRLREGDADFGRAATMAGACNAAPPGDARACRASGVGGDVLVGNLPFQDLNLPYEMTLDGHGRRFTYAVSELMTQPNGNNPTLQAVCVKKQEIDAAGNITERDCTAAADNPPQDIAIISHGRDGLGAWTAQGRPYVECGSSGTQMQNENCNNDGTLMLAQTTFAGATQNFNDDRMSVDILADSNYWQEMTEGILNRGEQFVGIGVDTPGRTLDVDGNVRAERVRTPQVCKRDGDDEADCFDPAVIAGDAGMRCGPTGFVKGIANSNVLCEPLMAAFSCPDDQVLVGITADGAPECRDPALPGDQPMSCTETFQTQEIDCAEGETGSISQRRDYTCNQAGEGSWSDWTETGRTCEAVPAGGDIIAGCFVDTWNWDPFSEGSCVGSGSAGTNYITFSVGDSTDQSRDNAWFGTAGVYKVRWTGDCTNGGTRIDDNVCNVEKPNGSYSATAQVYLVADDSLVGTFTITAQKMTQYCENMQSCPIEN